MRSDERQHVGRQDYLGHCDVDCEGGGDNDQDREEEAQTEHEDVVAEVRLEFPRGSTAEGLIKLNSEIKPKVKDVFPVTFRKLKITRKSD